MRLRGLVIAGILLTTSGVLAGNGASAQEKLKFYVNFIGGPEIQFFAVVKRGVEDAGKDLGVEAIYSAPKCCDINLQAQLLKSNVAAKPNGIAVEFNDPKALSRPILDALDANIPVRTNSIPGPRSERVCCPICRRAHALSARILDQHRSCRQCVVTA